MFKKKAAPGMALPLIKSPMTSCRVLSSLRGRQVDPVAGAEDLRLGHRSGARTDAGHGIVTAIVGEQYIYVDCPLSTGNVVTHEIEAMRTQGNFLIWLSPFNNNILIFPCRNGRHHGHRRGHRHDNATTRDSTLSTPKSKPTIKSSTQSFSLISPPLNILTTF